MKDTSVAARYARALFLVTERREETARALADLKGLAGIVEPGTRVGSFLATPQVRLQDKREVLRRVLEGRALRVCVEFLDLLLRKKRLKELESIVTEFEALVEKAQGIRRAHVVSAVALDERERDRLHATLESFTRARIRLTAEVDPAVLGGALVRIGDRVVDRTVRTLLDRMRQQLEEVSV